MTDATQQPDQRLCPLCGGNNHCALANGETSASCWCMDVKLKETALAALPADELGVRCICPGCGLDKEVTAS
ncbi:MAG: cysteine-rich CWC family protein [Halioglobus sp.]